MGTYDSSMIYTTVAKVMSLLQMPTRTSSTNPTEDEIQQLILRAQDKIDNITGHAWRTRYSGTNSAQETTAQYEMYDYKGTHEYLTGVPVHVKHRKIKDLDADEGDAFQFWNGQEWEDWLATKTEGRANDFWWDYERGILYFRGYVWSRKPLGVRLKYRYGETYVPYDIEEAATKMAAMEILAGMDSRTAVVAEGSPVMSHRERIEMWKEEVNEIIMRHKEFKVPSIM